MPYGLAAALRESLGAAQPLLRFLSAARAAGLRTSPGDTMDALRAVELVGLGDRACVRAALALVVAKSADDDLRFRACFDRSFARASCGQLGAEPPVGPAAPDAAAQPALLSPLGRLLQAADKAELARLVEEAAATVHMFDIRYLSQRSVYARRMMERVGLAALDEELAQRGAPDAGVQRVLANRQALLDGIHSLVDEQFALLAHGLHQQEQDEVLQRVRLAALDVAQRERMRAAVRVIVRRLRTRFGAARHRQRRAVLDAGATLRRMAAVSTQWPPAAIAAVCAFFGATAIGWNGVYLALLARLAPAGTAGSTTGAALAVTYGGVLFGPPAFALLTEGGVAYAAAFVLVAAPAVLCGAWLLARGWRA